MYFIDWYPIYIVSFAGKHTSFKEDDIERTFTYNDGLHTVTVARDRIALKKTSVPSVFPNCPSYLSEWNSKPNRLSLDDKERLHMESEYSKSITNNKETVDKFLINSSSDLLSKLNVIDLRNSWKTHVSDNNPLFFIKIIILETGSFIDRSLLVDDN